MSRKEARAIAGEIAKKLGETEAKPRYQLARIVMLCGAEFAQQILEETLQVETNGGLMTADGKRRRTPGGVFFYLARERMPEDERDQIFYPWGVAAKKKATQEAQYPPFDWAKRAQILQDVLAGKGEVSEVKISLTGRPGEIERRQNLVIAAMQDEIPERIAFPVGVPQPSADPMDYVVYISSKQWERVAEAIENPDDELVVEGLCTYDEETNGIAVFATFVTTKKLVKKEKKQSRKTQAATAKKPAKTGPTERPGATPEVRAGKPKPSPVVDVKLPPGVPADVARKLVDLHTAAATYRQKIAAIQARPGDQRFGLEMTQRLLSSTEKQIAELEKDYPDET